jgi:hypothetical protein
MRLLARVGKRNVLDDIHICVICVFICCKKILYFLNLVLFGYFVYAPSTHMMFNLFSLILM